MLPQGHSLFGLLFWTNTPVVKRLWNIKQPCQCLWNNPSGKLCFPQITSTVVLNTANIRIRDDLIKLNWKVYAALSFKKLGCLHERQRSASWVLILVVTVLMSSMSQRKERKRKTKQWVVVGANRTGWFLDESIKLSWEKKSESKQYSHNQQKMQGKNGS